MQADMQPESSGCNEVKYNLNVDTIEAIFKTYPAGELIQLEDAKLILIFVYLSGFVNDNLGVSYEVNVLNNPFFHIYLRSFKVKRGKAN